MRGLTMKMPAMQFYPADWRKDLAVQALDFFDRGVWFEILCLMHESSERGVLLLNSLPMPDGVLARLLGLDNQILTTTLTKLLTYGVARRRECDSAIFSKRMVEDEKLCKIRRQVGKLGGNPNLLKQIRTTPVNQSPTPSSSSSSSTMDNKDAHAILNYLNDKAERNYRPVPANLTLIAARLNDGATVDECFAVIDAKVDSWGGDPKWATYLRPATLFNATKFAQYVGEIGCAEKGETWE